MNKIPLVVTLILISLCSCRKANQDEVATSTALHSEVLSDLSSKVIVSTYETMHTHAISLRNEINLFTSTPTATQLATIRNEWRAVRSAWEMSEGFLFGPVSIDNIDPRIDTWPIDFARIDSVIAAGQEFTPEYIFGLEESLKGFHPLEYLIWGSDGNKTSDQFTESELRFASALANDIVLLSEQLNAAWDEYYHSAFTTAGNGSSVYPTRRAAYEEVLAAMSGICDEVANGKIQEPLLMQDPALEESPFAKNSMTDFYNNVLSVRNIYYGMYSTDGKGLEDLIRSQNLAMDAEIKTRIQAALNSLNNVTVPFGEAITSQQTQLNQAIAAINDLGSYLDETVLPFVQTVVAD